MSKSLAYLTRNLSPEQQQEFQDIILYITESVQRGSNAEGSLAKVLNRASPPVRQAFQLLSDTIETPRSAPFQPKLTEQDYAGVFGLDPDITTQAKASLDAEDVASQVQQRMGTDRQLPPEQPSLRDIVAAAVGGK